MIWLTALTTAALAQSPVVLLDGWHNNEERPHYRWDGKYAGGYSELGKLLGEMGAETKTATGPLTAAVLGSARCLVIVDPDTPAESKDPKYIQADEIGAIKDWVRDGGRLVLFGNDPGNAEFEHFNRLAGEFGIRFRESKHADAEGRTKLTLQVPAYQSVLAGGGTFYAVDVAPLELTAPGAQVLIGEGLTPIMGLVRYGKGEVVALGDPWIYDEYIHTRDNRRLAASLFRYLLQGALPATVRFDGSGVTSGPVAVASANEAVTVTWPDEAKRTWTAVFSLRKDRPLVTSISVNGKMVVDRATPVFRASVGKRRGGWDEFFDFPPAHADGTRNFRSEFQLKSASARTVGDRVEVSFEGLRLGIFEGVIRYTFYPGSRLLHQQAVVKTAEPDVAFHYDAGLRMSVEADRRPGGNMESVLVYYDTHGKLRREPGAGPEWTPVKARYRTLAAPTGQGSIAVFPAPHQYFFPRDFTTNMGYLFHSSWRGGVWLGIRQLPDDNSNFYPWANAPPGSEQKLGVFFLVSDGAAEAAIEDVLKFTNRDRYSTVPGYQPVAAHFHLAHTVQALEKGMEWVPPFKPVLKAMGVKAIMNSDFHGDGHPRDLTDLRFNELDAYYKVSRTQSDSEFLIVPGEEPNVHLGGHWAVTFPKPVYWMMGRPEGTAFRSKHPKFGTVYRVANDAELYEVLRMEKAQVYTSHPRTKGSRGYPDAYRDKPFYLDPLFLGGSWKAINTDYSSPRMGDRSLKLLDDMNNWGQPKKILGEADVFQFDETHELYAHMNINYVRLDRLPDFDNYSRVVDAISRGEFFVSTGEVLLPETKIAPGTGDQLVVTAKVRWTFPLRFAEIVWGDGKSTHRQEIALTDTPSFGEKSFRWQVEATGWKWARIAVWDIAANGAFVNPVWRQKP